MVAATPEPAVQLPAVEVTASRDQGAQIFGGNPLFDHAFADLRSGTLIEAILWRHHYLENHPHDEAVIVTTSVGNKIISATTVYTRDGKVFGSSNALGEALSIPGLVAADLKNLQGRARALKYIFDLRASMELPPAARLGRDDTYSPEFPPPLSALLVTAEETGDYGILGLYAANPALRRAMTQDYFTGRSDEILRWTYEALHNATRAGIVPVALAEIGAQGSGAANPAYAKFGRRPILVFDWDGAQYYYQPDVGTRGRALPVNAITGLPDLCLKNGALLECVHFCATYLRQHPDRKAVLVAGDPVGAAYQTEDKLGLFIPTLGGFTLPKAYLKAIDDHAYLGSLRDQVVAAKKPGSSRSDAIPQQIDGDDGDMQMRRAFLAFQAAGIPSRLHEEGPPSLDFDWEGLSYVYGSDQQVHPGSGTPFPPATPTSRKFSTPSFSSVERIDLSIPPLPDRTFAFPDSTVGQNLDADIARKIDTSVAKAEGDKVAATTPGGGLVVMPPYVVSTTALAKNPWRYASIPGFEVLSRASTEDTTWDLDGLRFGLWIQNEVIPKEWLPDLPVPCTVIIDDTNLAAIAATPSTLGRSNSSRQPMRSPWGLLAEKAKVSKEPISSDGDTFAINSNLYNIDTRGPSYASISLDRLLRCAPPLPRWVIAGLLGPNGLFREGFLIVDPPVRDVFPGPRSAPFRETPA